MGTLSIKDIMDKLNAKPPTSGGQTNDLKGVRDKIMASFNARTSVNCPTNSSGLTGVTKISPKAYDIAATSIKPLTCTCHNQTIACTANCSADVLTCGSQYYPCPSESSSCGCNAQYCICDSNYTNACPGNSQGVCAAFSGSCNYVSEAECPDLGYSDNCSCHAFLNPICSAHTPSCNCNTQNAGCPSNCTSNVLTCVAQASCSCNAVSDTCPCNSLYS